MEREESIGIVEGRDCDSGAGINSWRGEGSIETNHVMYQGLGFRVYAHMNFKMYNLPQMIVKHRKRYVCIE